MSEAPSWLGIAAAGIAVLAGSATLAWWLRTARTPPVAAATVDVGRGQMLYTMYCSACHGHEGRGDGPSAVDMNPPPTDLTSSVRKHATGVEAVRRVIRDGVPGTTMAANPFLPETDLDCLIAYTEQLARQPGSSPETLAHLRAAGLTPLSAPRDIANLEFRDLGDRPLRLADLRGRVVLLNFWSTTCVHCLDELPALERVQQSHAERGITVVSVCLDETDRERVEKLARRSAGKLPIYVEPSAQSRLHFDLEVMPVVFVLDRSGRLAGATRGSQNWSDHDVDALLRAFPK